MTQIKRVTQRRSRMARAIMGMQENTKHIRSQRTLTSQELLIARRMARDIKCSLEDIAAAINWDLTITTLWKKLRAVNIRVVNGNLGHHLRSHETRQ